MAHGPRRHRFARRIRQQVADRRRHADPQAEQRGRADRLVHRLAAQGHRRHGQRAAADTHHRGDRADRRPECSPRRVRRAGPGAARRRRAAAPSSAPRAAPPRRTLPTARGHPRSKRTASPRMPPIDDRQRPASHHRAVDSAAPGMRPRRGDGRRHDGRHRGGHRHVQGDRRLDARQGQRQVERGHDDDAAADAEQPREQPARRARAEQRRQQGQPLDVRFEQRSAAVPSWKTAAV